METHLKRIKESLPAKNILLALLALIIALVIFRAGMEAGLAKARFSAGLGDNFHRVFTDPRGPGGLPRNDMIPGGHGATGRVVSVALPILVVEGPDNIEKTVLVGSSTLVRRYRSEVQASEIAIGDNVLVLGLPREDGEIEAALIRIVPADPMNATTTYPFNRP